MGVKQDLHNEGYDMSDQYEFDLRATAHDREGYYYPRWDQAQKLTITAPTKQEAINKAAVVLGPCRDGRGWFWGFKVDAIRSAVKA